MVDEPIPVNGHASPPDFVRYSRRRVEVKMNEYETTPRADSMTPDQKGRARPRWTDAEWRAAECARLRVCSRAAIADKMAFGAGSRDE